MYALLMIAVSMVAVVEDPGLAGQVGKLVEQLNAETLDDRESAEEALVELGPRRLSHLPTADARMPRRPSNASSGCARRSSGSRQTACWNRLG